MLSLAMTALLVLHVTCVVLHVATAAAWFGIAMRVSGESRAVARAEAGVARVLAESGGLGVRQMGTFLVLTLVFGLGAVLTNGGFESYSWTLYWYIHVSLALLVGLILVHYALVAPAWRRLTEDASKGGGGGARGRVAAAIGIGHLLWLAILVLMFWRRFEAAVSVG